MYNMPPVTKNIIIINVLFFLAMYVTPRYGIDLTQTMGLHFFMASDFKIYQLLTYMFMHGNFAHILFNMFAVWMFGRIVESAWGSRRFLIYYLICGIGAGLFQEIVQYIDYVASGMQAYDSVDIGTAVIPMDTYLNMLTTVGASGAVYGILLAFGLSYPEERLFIIPIPIPIKAKYFVIGYAVIELLSGLYGSNDGVAHFAHLGGMVVGFLLILYWTKKNSMSGGYLEKINNWFQNRRKPKMKVHYGEKEADYQYNARKKENQEEIDRILDKVRKSGYESLTVDEKKKLFESSNK
ncbi:MAG: rhomboid family intramembrane serine protease [Bacteroidaceae bacterium]|jgi:membrane associated rhomboid family serine protease|nr:rhomboid family intramembrane serine protease [Bacteroidaceae bacterium]MBR6990161.1 rhomboid family intramembrane serine protease [Bacteroidaceae bacterium]